jgi:hypothetical protein
MNLEEIYYIGQTIAVVAILGSLAGIFLQLRQANKIARIDFSQRVSSNYSDSIRELMSNPALADAFRKAMFERKELSPAESTQILTYFNLTIAAHSDAFLAYDEGLIDRSLLDGLDHNTTWYLTAPVFGREWRRICRLGLFSAEFIEHLNSRQAALHPEGAAETPSDYGVRE